ncbi:MAG: hypothetical protein KGL39_25775 [Patescibacteria group bacterium]|nr:hypothetical protein [Patescibacteria group bacterium]
MVPLPTTGECVIFTLAQDEEESDAMFVFIRDFMEARRGCSAPGYPGFN